MLSIIISCDNCATEWHLIMPPVEIHYSQRYFWIDSYDQCEGIVDFPDLEKDLSLTWQVGVGLSHVPTTLSLSSLFSTHWLVLCSVDSAKPSLQLNLIVSPYRYSSSSWLATRFVSSIGGCSQIGWPEILNRFFLWHIKHKSSNHNKCWCNRTDGVNDFWRYNI